MNIFGENEHIRSFQATALKHVSCLRSKDGGLKGSNR